MNKLEQEIHSNPQAAKIALDIMARGKKPPGWSRRSCSPYYNARYANELKVALDDMLKSGQDTVFPVNDGRQRSINSIYLRINQGFRYLMDYLDKDSVYAQLNERLRIKREAGVGVRLMFVTGEDDIGLPAAKIQKRMVNRLSWKDAVDSYLENAQIGDEPLLIESVVLLPSQIQELRTALAMLKDRFIFSITAKSIKIIRMA